MHVHLYVLCVPLYQKIRNRVLLIPNSSLARTHTHSHTLTHFPLIYIVLRWDRHQLLSVLFLGSVSFLSTPYIIELFPVVVTVISLCTQFIVQQQPVIQFGNM